MATLALVGGLGLARTYTRPAHWLQANFLNGRRRMAPGVR